MYFPFLYHRAWIILLIILLIIGAIRWGTDALKYQFGGKQAKKRDQDRTMQRLDRKNQMFFQSPKQSDTSDRLPDENIEKLIKEGRLKEAMAESRNLRMIAIEMNDHDTAAFYSGYETRISKILNRDKYS